MLHRYRLLSENAKHVRLSFLSFPPRFSLFRQDWTSPCPLVATQTWKDTAIKTTRCSWTYGAPQDHFDTEKKVFHQTRNYQMFCLGAGEKKKKNLHSANTLVNFCGVWKSTQLFLDKLSVRDLSFQLINLHVWHFQLLCCGYHLHLQFLERLKREEYRLSHLF